MKFSVLFFDGDCLLCSRVVHWIIKNDTRGNIYFCTLEDGRNAGIPNLGKDTIILWYDEKTYQKSEAVSIILKLLGGFYKVLGLMLSIMPKSISNWFYDLVAKNRYRWFGQKDNCLIPHPSWSHRIWNAEKIRSEFES